MWGVGNIKYVKGLLEISRIKSFEKRKAFSELTLISEIWAYKQPYGQPDGRTKKMKRKAHGAPYAKVCF